VNGQSLGALYFEGYRLNFAGPVTPNVYIREIFGRRSRGQRRSRAFGNRAYSPITGIVAWNYTITVPDYYQVGTRADPTTFVGPVLTDTEHDDERDNDVTVTWTDWGWAQITIPTPALLQINPADKSETASLQLSENSTGVITSKPETRSIHFTDT